ncbi:MAG: hypothetical protein RJA57_416 [Bacteroidota bacterium]|jgi:hypothetical protein
MKKGFHLIILALCCSAYAHAQWPSQVQMIDMEDADSVVVKGDLSTGAPMEDLSWAWNSSNACFPGTQASKFRGHHKFFAVTLGPRSEMRISVTPDDAKSDLSLYAYSIGGSEYRLVPNLSQCITCEADHKWDRPVRGKVQTSERKVSFQNPTKNTYNVLIGVSGPAAATAGTFQLKVVR